MGKMDMTVRIVENPSHSLITVERRDIAVRSMESIFYPFSHPLHIFVKMIFFLIHVDQKYSMKQFEIFP